MIGWTGDRKRGGETRGGEIEGEQERESRSGRAGVGEQER